MFNISILGESPPPPPRVCFGRDKLIENVICLAEALDPIALIGSGGIGKTSIALTVLHHDRIKERFGDNRRFIRCDQFPASRAHFLSKLSKVIGAGVENPEDLAPLRPFLSSKEIFIILDNIESILDPQGLNARDIYAVVEELSQFKTICLCITSRMSTVPRHCKRPVIPTLSMEAACDIFYSICDHGERSDIVNDLLQRLDFHPLSITLLATAASHNMWDYNELAEEWEIHRAQTLRTDYDESLAATIELSLASPTFCKLGAHARELLGVVAFFPRGINKSNIDWLFPTISDRKDIFNKFCVLSLTYRSNSAFAMLAPLRDHLRPRDPRSSPLLCAAKDHYFRRLSVHLEPGKPTFEEAHWITSEDVNVEHLLDVFTSIENDSDDVWNACSSFMEHLYWHKNRLVVLGPKIEALPEDHYYKPELLFELSRLFQSVGNYTEQKRLLTHTLKLERKWGNDYEVARSLRRLSDGNRRLGLCEEGIQQVKEALRILERLHDTGGQAQCLISLAWLFYEDNRLDAAEESASRAINLLPEEGQEFRVCQSHRILGEISRLKGEREKAVRYLETALGIASPFNWHDQLFWIHHSLVELFRNEGKFDNAHAHLERAKVHTIDDTYSLGRAASLQAWLWYDQRRFEDARSEALRANDIFENIGAARDLEDCRDLLRNIERAMWSRPTSGESGSTGKSLGTMLYPAPVDVRFPILSYRHTTQPPYGPPSRY